MKKQVSRKPAASAELVQTFTLPRKLAEALAERAQYMMPCTVEWLIEDALESEVDSLKTDATYRSDTRDAFMSDLADRKPCRVKAAKGARP